MRFLRYKHTAYSGHCGWNGRLVKPSLYNRPFVPPQTPNSKLRTPNSELRTPTPKPFIITFSYLQRQLLATCLHSFAAQRHMPAPAQNDSRWQAGWKKLEVRKSNI